jgi:hypothetical protein
MSLCIDIPIPHLNGVEEAIFSQLTRRRAACRISASALG